MNTDKPTRWLPLLLCAAMLFCLAACNGSIETNNPGSTASTPTAALITIGVKDGAPEVAPTDVTQAELDAAEKIYRDQVAQLTSYQGIDRMKVVRGYGSALSYEPVLTEISLVDRWLDFFRTALVEGQTAVPTDEIVPIKLLFYDGEDLIASVIYEGAIYTESGRVMLAFDEDAQVAWNAMELATFSH